MKLGFIGTGKIASSVITGICSSKISFTKILVSPQNKLIANTLKKKFKKVNIAKNNQDIVNKIPLEGTEKPCMKSIYPTL